MHQKERKVQDQITLFPDTISDDHSTRGFLALILFATFLIIFDYQTLKSERKNFLSKYEVTDIDETPTWFENQKKQGIQFNNQSQYKLSTKLPINKQLDTRYLGQEEESFKCEDLFSEEECKEQYEQYKNDLKYFKYFYWYFVIDCICTGLQYIFGSVSTYQNQNKMWLVLLTFFIYACCGAFSFYRFFNFSFNDRYYFIFKFVIELLLLTYALFLVIKRVVIQKKKIGILGEFFLQYQVVCYEYTYQKLYRRVSSTWNDYQEKKIDDVQIQMYLNKESILLKENKKLEDNDYFKKTSFQILKDIITPFSSYMNKKVIGDFIYFPIKFISALFLAIYIYFFLLQLCIQMAQFLEELGNNFKEQYKTLREQGETPTEYVNTDLVNAFKIAFYLTISLEFILLIVYSFYLSHRFKKETIRLRRGQRKFGVPGDPYQTIKFYAFYCGNFLLAFLILTVFITLFIALMLFKPFWKFLWGLIKKHYVAIITLIVNIVIFKIFRLFTMKGNNVTRKRLLMAGELFYIITAIPTVLTKGLIRIVMAMIGNLIEIFRIDKPVIGGYLARFDSAYNTFVGMVLMNHYQNNPIMLTYIDLLEECVNQTNEKLEELDRVNTNDFQTQNDIEQQNLNQSLHELKTNEAEKKQQIEKMNKQNYLKKKQIINRFHLCVLLALNPSLCKYRKSDNNDQRLFETKLDQLKKQNTLHKKNSK